MRYNYPLAWPIGWPKTKGYKDGAFKVSYDVAVRELSEELERLDAESAYLSTDQELRVTGTPRRDRDPRTPGVALYFTRGGKQLCIPCDRFYSVRDNIRAIGLTLEALRRMERYGTSQMVEAALSGFQALPAGSQFGADYGSGESYSVETVRPPEWHEVLQVLPSADISVIRSAYRNLSAKYHPDNKDTADVEAFHAVQEAWNKARELKGE